MGCKSSRYLIESYMGAVTMKLNFASLAFGYAVEAGGSTPNWATSLGQGQAYKINDTYENNELVKGMVYSSVHISTISTSIGKGGKLASGRDLDTPIVMGAVFSDVYVNDTKINDGKLILIITRDTSKSHSGRLRLKYGPSNTYTDEINHYTNKDLFDQIRTQLGLAEEACWFVYSIDVINQNKIVLKTCIVNKNKKEIYDTKEDLHSAWAKLIGESLNDNEKYNEETDLTNGANILYYGVPGSGKSYTVDRFCKDTLSDEQYMRRVVFHPDYTYSDFVGQILPTLELDEADNTEKLRYKFHPGPFTQALKIAYENPTENCVLVIEELNRGNAPAIFGEIFQLLDREEDVTSPIFGRSKYGINNTDIANEVFGNKNKLVYLPSNLSIIATMNTSDQNVFTLDTAFQRRWKMEYVPNVFEGAQADTKIVGSNITWKAFAETVNDIISRNSFNIGSTEDKGLGAYFAIGKDLEDKKGFAEKVLKYLWDDAVKLDRKRIFNAGLFNLPSMFNAFNNGGLEAVLQSTVYEQMLNESKSVVEPEIDTVNEVSEETGENV